MHDNQPFIKMIAKQIWRWLIADDFNCPQINEEPIRFSWQFVIDGLSVIGLAATIWLSCVVLADKF